MATKKQIESAKKNIKKTQKIWKETSHRQRALAQPQGRDRAKMGKTRGRWVLLHHREPREALTVFCYYDGGEKGYILCLSGRRESGFWITLVWLISKSYANMAGEELVPDTKDAQRLIEFLAS